MILRRFTAGARGLGRAVFDMLLPSRCACCDAQVEASGQLCAACFRLTEFITEPLCARCGVPFAIASQGGASRLCHACEASPPVFAQARAALRYDAQCRRLILPFKHADQTDIAGILAPMMVRAGAPLLAHAELLVPVPLHRYRLFRRRYNQAALLARSIGIQAGLPVLVDALRRTRVTASLGEKSAEERAAEVAGVFAVRPRCLPRLAGRRLLLIDDVMTSGATANACAAALLAAGASVVDVLVAARVPDPRLG